MHRPSCHLKEPKLMEKNNWLSIKVKQLKLIETKYCEILGNTGYWVNKTSVS